MKVKVMYDVFKYVRVVKSNKDESLIFKDERNKIYFIDRKFNEGYDKLDDSYIGDEILVWVRKELDKVGYVSIMIDGVGVKSFIDKFIELTSSELMSIIPNTHRSIVHVSNYLYNNDMDFNHLLTLDNKIELLPYGRTVVDNYDKIGINSELAEFIYELQFALAYLYNKFSSNEE